jgi:hypothetical protein
MGSPVLIPTGKIAPVFCRVEGSFWVTPLSLDVASH